MRRWPGFIASKKMTVMGLNDLDQIRDYAQYQRQARNFLCQQQKISEPLVTKFFQKLDGIKSKDLSNPEKLIVANFAVRHFGPDSASEDVGHYIDAVLKLKEAFGLLFLSSLLERPREPDFDLKRVVSLFQLLINLKEKMDCLGVLQDSKNSLSTAYEILLEKRMAFFKSSENSADDILVRFEQKNEWVVFPLAKNQLETLRSGEKYFTNYAFEILTWGNSRLIEEAKKIGKSLPEKKESESRIRLLALIIELLKREMKLTPYETQRLAVEALNDLPTEVKGQIAQIRTSEGKTLIVVLLAAFWACQDKCVDVITSSRELAILAQAKFSRFYFLLGVRSSHICRDRPEACDFDAPIIYTTIHDLEFSILRDQFFQTELRFTTINGKLIRRPLQIAIADEGDCLFIDSALNASRVAIPSAEKMHWVYAPIFEFVKLFGANAQDPSELRSYLSDFQDGKYAEQVQDFSDCRLKLWQNSAWQALHHYSEDHEYTILDGKIQIVDAENTGRISSESRWSHGIHEFLEIKHGLDLGEESDTLASISHPALFQQYEILFGLTGTVGELEERKEVEILYQVSTFDVPPHFIPKRTIKSPCFSLTFDAHFQEIFEALQENIRCRRPSLVLFTYIKDSKDFSAFLSIKGYAHQVLNAVQEEDEEFLVSCAGKPEIITIATNVSGRGTDILLAEVSKQAGGLEVLLGFYPINKRVEDQNSGRAYRRGEPGSYRIFICANDPFVKKLIPNEFERNALSENPNFMQVLNEKRTDHITQLSKHRIRQSNKEIAHYELTVKFSKILDSILKDLNEISLDSLAETCASLCEISDGHAVFPAHHSLYAKQQYGLNLVYQQNNGVVIDWESAFLKPMIKVYHLSLQQKWARFFSDLEIENLEYFPESKAEYEELLNRKYQEFFDRELKSHLEDTTMEFIEFIGRLLMVDLNALIDNACKLNI